MAKDAKGHGSEKRGGSSLEQQRKPYAYITGKEGGAGNGASQRSPYSQMTGKEASLWSGRGQRIPLGQPSSGQWSGGTQPHEKRLTDLADSVHKSTYGGIKPTAAWQKNAAEKYGPTGGWGVQPIDKKGLNTGIGVAKLKSTWGGSQ